MGRRRRKRRIKCTGSELTSHNKWNENDKEETLGKRRRQWEGEGESGGSNAQAESSLPIRGRRQWEGEGDNGKEMEKAADQVQGRGFTFHKGKETVVREW